MRTAPFTFPLSDLIRLALRRFKGNLTSSRSVWRWSSTIRFQDMVMRSDLEQFLQHYSELVLINLWDQTSEASLDMDRLMQDVEHTLSIPVLRLRLTEHREWARAHGVYGTPALLAYYRGQPVFRFMGRITLEELTHRLQHLER